MLHTVKWTDVTCCNRKQGIFVRVWVLARRLLLFLQYFFFSPTGLIYVNWTNSWTLCFTFAIIFRILFCSTTCRCYSVDSILIIMRMKKLKFYDEKWAISEFWSRWSTLRQIRSCLSWIFLTFSFETGFTVMAHEFKAANMVRVTMLQLDISDASNKLIRVADCTIYLRMRAPRNMIEYIIYALLRIVDIREKKKRKTFLWMQRAVCWLYVWTIY